MRRKSFITVFILSSLIIVFCLRLNSQTTITGPSCVIPGLAIQYLINGSWTNTSTIEVCIKNGKLESSGSSCYNGKPLSYIRVIWDNNGTNGSISINSSSGSASQNVRITRQLKAGIIDSPLERQVIENNTVPSSISCSPALWGTCDPVYSYQWQRSADRSNWINIPGETNKSLNFSQTLTQSFFFRRKVTETKTHAVGISNEAFVYVKPQ